MAQQVTEFDKLQADVIATLVNDFKYSPEAALERIHGFYHVFLRCYIGGKNGIDIAEIIESEGLFSEPLSNKDKSWIVSLTHAAKMMSWQRGTDLKSLVSEYLPDYG